MSYKKIKFTVPRSADKESRKAFELLLKALEEVYKELDRLEKEKQDA